MSDRFAAQCRQFAKRALPAGAGVKNCAAVGWNEKMASAVQLLYGEMEPKVRDLLDVAMQLTAGKEHAARALEEFDRLRSCAGGDRYRHAQLVGVTIQVIAGVPDMIALPADCT